MMGLWSDKKQPGREYSAMTRKLLVLTDNEEVARF